MKAAIYVRYSSDLQREASIVDQIRLCNERIKSNGWTLVEIYRDSAISGANIANRPGIQALLCDAKEEKFDVVVAEALDRLSRDQEDIAAIFKRLRHREIAICTLAEGEVNELHIGLKGTMNALFLKDLAAKIRRGQRGRIAEGYSAGGLSYGYEIVRALDEKGEIIKGQRRINAAQSRVVERIFTEYVAGKSPRAIAARLNRDGVPSPRGKQWNASTINGHRARRNGILQNELYIGVMTYNRVRMVKDPDTGKRISRINPKDEWIVEEVPELRIVSDEIWNGAQAIKARRGSQPAHKSRQPKRLFSGMLKCGECGGGYTIVRPGRYGCSAHREKGTCANPQQIAADKLESHILAGLKQRLLEPHLLAEFVEEFHRELERLRETKTSEAPCLERQLADTDSRIQRIVAAIAEGTDSPSLREQLIQYESLKVELRSRLKHTEVPRVVDLRSKLPKIYREKVESLECALHENDVNGSEASTLVRSLIDKIVLSPGEKQRELSIEIYGEAASIFALARGNPLNYQDMVPMVVAEEGLEPPTRGL